MKILNIVLLIIMIIILFYKINKILREFSFKNNNKPTTIGNDIQSQIEISQLARRNGGNRQTHFSCGIDLTSAPARFYPFVHPLRSPASPLSFRTKFPPARPHNSVKSSTTLVSDETLSTIFHPQPDVISEASECSKNSTTRGEYSPPLSIPFMFSKCARIRWLDRNKIA